MYCKNCGAEIDDKAVVCLKCGAAAGNDGGITAGIKDDGNLGWGLLGCCIPIVGLILYLVWKDTKPNTAKMAGKGALIAAVCLILYYIGIIGFAFSIGVSGH
ncbi:zinc ribbon domain-containing protein [Blautia coccoides]|uniref:zinc ribbon domain-containing protein n=1 Tax=Blautia producta TaxID=33035 RepID=UPI002149D601|nr:zinc ribbon domain-containing protein [Blautia coccoides]MCR1985048.1 zinc ribbon domain-containing protein [Blautia coccoides]